jgi:hypothetical protein
MHVIVRVCTRNMSDSKGVQSMGILASDDAEPESKKKKTTRADSVSRKSTLHGATRKALGNWTAKSPGSF